MASVRAKILAVANTKGGVGKSTLATNLAVEAARAGLGVLLVDTDPQASSTLFTATRPEERPSYRVVQLSQPILHREVPKLAEPFDLAILDTGGRETATFRSALAASGRVLVPITPSAYDVWASEDVFTLLDELSASRDDLEASVVLNQVLPRTRIAQEALDALDELAGEQGIGVLQARLGARVAWKVAASRGLSVAEHEPSGRAAEELRALCRELGLFEPVGGAATTGSG